MAIVRFVIFTQLLLVLVGGCGLTRLIAARSRSLQALAAAAVIALIAAEAHQSHEMVDVVEPADGSVYDVMRDLDEGRVLELPIPGHDQGIVQAFLESTRMVLSSDDELRSINGYSGHTPKDYDADGVRRALAEARPERPAAFRAGVTPVASRTSGSHKGRR